MPPVATVTLVRHLISFSYISNNPECVHFASSDLKLRGMLQYIHIIIIQYIHIIIIHVLALLRSNCGYISAVLYHRWGKLDFAKKHYELSLELDPSATGTRENYSMLRRKLNQQHKTTV